MRRFLNKILLVSMLLITVSGCNKKQPQKFINGKTGKEEQINIIRFDRELFATPDPDIQTYLKGLQKKYPEVLNADLDNRQELKIIEDFINDSYVQDAQNLVQRTYPDLTFLEKDLTSAFALLKKQHGQTVLPKRVFSLMSVPYDFSLGFDERTYTNGDYCFIALDVYSFPAIEKNPYYKQFPLYMQQKLNKNYIAADFMRMYIKNITYKDAENVQMNPDCTLLDCIIDEGKYSYIIKNILPQYGENIILGYTDEQMQWCNDNEKMIWGYIIQNRLLYEKDRSKYMSLTAEGPTSKPLSDSPSRVGNFIGYKIVENFMDKEKISFDSLMNITDPQMILKKSNYKPKK